MSSRSRNGTPLATFTPLPRPERQVRFPTQRRTVKPARRSLPLSFEQPPSSETRRATRQSTLTQMPEFLPPSSGRVMVGISSDEDESYEEPRPRKRRRQSEGRPRSLLKKEKSSTLTQMDFFSSAEGVTKIEDSEDEEGMSDMEDAVGSTRAAQNDENNYLRQKRTTKPQTRKTASRQLSFEIPESSQLVPVKPEPDMVQETQHPRQDGLSTPRKTHSMEIPSSQTPSSIGLSTRNSDHALRFRDPDRSPLKERSGNVRFVSPVRRQIKRSGPVEIEKYDENDRSHLRHEGDDDSTASEDDDEDEDYDPHQEPSAPTVTEESQPMTLKMLQKVHLANRKIPLNDTARAPSVSKNATPSNPTLPPPTPRVPSTLSAPAPRGILKRVATVQDSQADDLDLDDGAVGETQFHADNEYDDYEYNDDEPATFDPANTALDRDAARFRWTQTQGNSIFSQVYDMGPEAETLCADDAEFEPGLLDAVPSSSAVEVVEPVMNNVNVSEDMEMKQLIAEEPKIFDQQSKAPHAIEHPLSDPQPVPASQTRELPATVPDSDVESGDEDLGAEYKRTTNLESKSCSKPSQRNSGSEDESVPSSQPRERSSKAQDEIETVQVPSSPPVLSEPPMHVQTQPPPLRPSQISTYMSTQGSPRRLMANRGANGQEHAIAAKGTDAGSHVDQVPSESLMSSPLPLPPSTFPSSQFDYQESLMERRPNKSAMGNDALPGSETQLPALSDFSLPPPPPSSSRSPQRQTTRFHDSVSQSQVHTTHARAQNDKHNSAHPRPPSRRSGSQMLFTSQTDGSMEGFATAPTSPIALPPWSDGTVKDSTETIGPSVKRDENGETQLPSLVDFSLPPPPPMSSSVVGDSEL